MLQELSIRNFAIIDDLQISFSDGLTMLTGETGAGKSIIINAVNLLLGGRATAKLIRTGAPEAELEALFRIPVGSPLTRFLEENGYGTEDGLLIRRIISANDRHRIFLNGRLATAQLLNAATENLASISGQHAHQGLLQETQQLQIVDQFGGLMSLREKLFDQFHQILPMIRQLRRFKQKESSREEHLVLLAFQRREIHDAAVTIGEDEQLEQERNRLKNAELLYQTVSWAIEDLYSAQGAAVERLAAVAKELARLGKIDSSLQAKADSITDTMYRIEDFVEGLRAYLAKLDTDTQRLETVETRLDLLQKLKRKYGGTLEAVIARDEAIDQELTTVENLSAEIAKLESSLAGRHALLAELSAQLSEKRRQTAVGLAELVVLELASLKMPQTQFQARFSSIEVEPGLSTYLQRDQKAITEYGSDRVEFLISPNVGEELRPLARIASGGELSRVVLALKAILAKTESVETLVFDEVDAGIGGGTADVVGRKLAELARFHQVLCITHLPQIAKYGAHHYRISKRTDAGRTRTEIFPLEKEKRVMEIARMLGGEKITDRTLAHAKELLSEA